MKKAISAILCALSFVYTIWYMHFATPYKHSGALSQIGIEHKLLFIIWGALTFSALAYSICLAYKRYLNTKIYIPLLAVSGIGMVLFLTFNFDYDNKTSYYLHCAGSLSFSVIMGTTIFLLFLLCFKKGLIFRILTFLCAAILLTDLFMLLIFKENALIEVLPIFAGFIMLNTVIFRRDKIETKQYAEKS